MRHVHKKAVSSARRGVVLIAVLVVVVLLSLAAYQYSDFMMEEYKANDSYLRSAQTRAYAESGVHYLAAVLQTPDAINNFLAGNPFDNAAAFQGIMVNEKAAPRFIGRFSVVSPLDPDDPSGNTQGFRFGVTDEGGKINLNALLQLDSSGRLALNMLMQLPNMTEDIANAILDWLDPDDDERSGGAENITYSVMGYRCKNGPLDSLDELLMVKGVTPQLLYGNDRNRNGILDPNEDDGSGVLDRGWSAYFTLNSRELNVDSQGNPRINVNGKDLNQLLDDLTTAVGADLANFIVAARQYGLTTPQTGTPSGGSSGTPAGGGRASTGGAPTTPPTGGSGRPASGGGGGGGSMNAGGPLSRGTLNLGGAARSKQTIASLFDLINSTVSIPNSNPQGQPTIYASPLSSPDQLTQLLPALLDKTTTQSKTQFIGRINVNTAPLSVLQGLPGIEDADVQAIISNRPNPSSLDPADPIFQTPAWLITQANLTPAKVKALERYITTTTQVYRAQVLGYFDSGGPTTRLEVVIDSNQGYPRVLYWRDLTELGRGFNLNAATPQ
jgi:type II secretory pathway component PulK